MPRRSGCWQKPARGASSCNWRCKPSYDDCCEGWWGLRSCGAPAVCLAKRCQQMMICACFSCNCSLHPSPVGSPIGRPLGVCRRDSTRAGVTVSHPCMHRPGRVAWTPDDTPRHACAQDTDRAKLHRACRRHTSSRQMQVCTPSCKIGPLCTSVRLRCYICMCKAAMQSLPRV